MRHPLLLTALLLAFTGPLAAQTAPRATTREGHRFLILIEASRDMNRLADGVIETSLHLVNGGFKGQIRDGDAFVFWLYRDRVASHLFEPTVWSTARLREHSAYVEGFVAPLKFEGQADLALAMKELLAVGAASDSATLILLSPGEKPVTGTPFDDYIKAAYAREGRQSRSAKLPVVTSFLASGGAIVDCVVSRGGTNLTLPTLPESLRNKPRILTVPAPAPVVPTNAPVQKKSTTPPPKKLAAVESPPAAGTAAPSTARAPAPAGTNSPGMSLGPIAPRSLPAVGAAGTPPSNTPPAVVTAATPPAPPSPPPQAAPQPPAPAPTPAATTPATGASPSQTDSAPPAAAIVPATPSPVAPVETSPAADGSSPRRTSLILAGVMIGAAGVLALVLLALLMRPARGSSISAVMESAPPRATRAEAKASSSAPVPPA